MVKCVEEVEQKKRKERKIVGMRRMKTHTNDYTCNFCMGFRLQLYLRLLLLLLVAAVGLG